MENTLKGIVKQVAEAQNFDANGDYKAAYVKYLESIQCVTQQLLNNALQAQGVCGDATTKKLVSLSVMCIQRTEDIVNNQMGMVKSNSSTLTSTNGVPSAVTSAVTSPTGTLDIRPYGGDSGATSISSPVGSVTSALSSDLPVYTSNTVSPSPVELAEKQNRLLMSAYRARMSGLNNHKATSMSLSLQRRFAENLAIGKAREQSLAKKRAERRIRLEAEAAKRFSSTVGMSEDELERRRVYTRILEYEQDNKWLLPWREKLKGKSEDCLLIQELVNLVLRLHKHPLTQLLYAYQHKIFNEAQPILNQWHYARQKSLQHQISATSQTGDDNQVPTHSPTDDSPGSDVMVGSARIQDRCESSNIRDSRGSKSLSTTAYDVSDFDDLFEVGCDGDDDDDNDGDGDGDDDDDDGDDGDDDGDDVIAHGVVNNTKNSSNCAADNEDSHTLESTNNLDLGSNPSAISSLEDHSDAPVEKSDYICDTGSLLNSPLISLQELDREAILRHLVNITRDTQDYLERLVTMFIVAYDSLDHATGRDCCYSTLEQPFYKPLWNHLLSLFRLVYQKEECQAQSLMLHHRHSSPEDFSIPRKFCLHPEDSLLMPEGYLPYQPAIDELRGLTSMVSPLSKLECIVQVSRLICRCVEEFYTNNKSQVPNIGADDLLPLLSYVVVKADMPHILAECHALEDLVHEGYLLGEEGYCLTSLETAVKFVLTMEH